MKKYRRYVAIDFDATLVHYGQWNGKGSFGQVIDGAVAAINRIRDAGVGVIINTTRLEIDQVADFLRQRGIQFDHINWSPLTEKLFLHPAKVMAHCYVDDR